MGSGRAPPDRLGRPQGRRRRASGRQRGPRRGAHGRRRGPRRGGCGLRGDRCPGAGTAWSAGRWAALWALRATRRRGAPLLPAQPWSPRASPDPWSTRWSAALYSSPASSLSRACSLPSSGSARRLWAAASSIRLSTSAAGALAGLRVAAHLGKGARTAGGRSAHGHAGVTTISLTCISQNEGRIDNYVKKSRTRGTPGHPDVHRRGAPLGRPA